MCFYKILFELDPTSDMVEDLYIVPINKATNAMKSELLEPQSGEEVKFPLFHMLPTKAPGFDGYHAYFFQCQWDNCCYEVTADSRYHIALYHIFYLRMTHHSSLNLHMIKCHTLRLPWIFIVWAMGQSLNYDKLWILFGDACPLIMKEHVKVFLNVVVLVLRRTILVCQLQMFACPKGSSRIFGSV